MKKTLILLLLFMGFGCDNSAKSLCGNNTLDPGEICDGDEFDYTVEYQDCRGYGYTGGMLRCSDSCTLDYSECEEYGKCGDGIKAPMEDCDGEDIGDATCESLGFYGGDLSCTSDCKILIRDCGRCFDGIIQESEVCDLFNSGEFSCADEEKFGGPYICENDCSGPDYSRCDGLFHLSSLRYDGLDAISFDSAGNIMTFGYTGGNLFGETNGYYECTTKPFYDENGYKIVVDTRCQPCFDAAMVKITPDGRVSSVKQYSENMESRIYFLNKTPQGDFTILHRKEGSYYYGCNPEYGASINYQTDYLEVINESFGTVSSVPLDGLPIDIDISTRISTENSVLIGGIGGWYNQFAAEISLDGTVLWTSYPVVATGGSLTSIAIYDENTALVTSKSFTGIEELFSINRNTGDSIKIFSCPDTGATVSDLLGVAPVVAGDASIMLYCAGESGLTEYTLDLSGAVSNEQAVEVYGTLVPSGARIRAFQTTQTFEAEDQGTLGVVENPSKFYLNVQSSSGELTRYGWTLDSERKVKGFEIQGDTIWFYGELTTLTYREGFLFKKEFPPQTLSN